MSTNGYHVLLGKSRGIEAYMRKILHISKYYSPFQGGTEQIAQDCVSSLSDLYEQKVICFNHKKGDEREYVDGIEIIRCGCIAKISSQSLSISYGNILRKTLNVFKPDIIVFHYPNPFVAHLLLKYISKKTKFVIYWHLDIVKQRILKNLFIGQNHRLIRRADLLIATSPRYVEGSPYLSSASGKCKIIPNCINVERFRLSDESVKISSEIREKNCGKIICFAVGRHTEYKGFSYLIQASQYLDDRFAIFIAGKGELTKDLVKEAEGDKKIHFLGSIDDIELKAYLNAMDIFCFPSITKNEAFGLALAEGMYYGKPAVTFNIPGSGVNYVCLNGGNGIEVPNRDSKAYAAAMTRLADDPELRQRLGKAGKERVINNFLSTQFKDNIIITMNKL